MFYLPLSLFNFISLLNFFKSLLHNFIIFPPKCFYSLLHNFYYFPFSIFFIPLLHLHLLISIVFLPQNHHYHHHHHISVVFFPPSAPPPPPPPSPPHFDCFDRVDVGSMWGRCGVDVVSMWGRCRVDVGSMSILSILWLYLRGQSWRVRKSWYIGEGPDHGSRRCFADGLK